MGPRSRGLGGDGGGGPSVARARWQSAQPASVEPVLGVGVAYQVTKTYGHERGLSCCFRQPQAQSHCALMHGYAVAVSLTFEAHRLENHWVLDFGGLKPVEAWLKWLFDHTLLVACDDPERI